MTGSEYKYQSSYQLKLIAWPCPSQRIIRFIGVCTQSFQLHSSKYAQKEDPYGRPRPNSVFAQGDTDTEKSYKVLNKRIVKKGGKVSTQYPARCQDYGPEFDEWLTASALENAQDLINDYETPLAASGAASSPIPPVPIAPAAAPLALTRERGRPKMVVLEGNWYTA